tara:strand:+ start:429 stop:599 length:171 start_codon:yes stop_codon:yes gene_type:complete
MKTDERLMIIKISIVIDILWLVMRAIVSEVPINSAPNNPQKIEVNDFFLFKTGRNF